MPTSMPRSGQLHKVRGGHPQGPAHVPNSLLNQKRSRPQNSDYLPRFHNTRQIPN